MSFFKNLSGKKWAVKFFPKEFYGAFYTPWFGWSYNLHPNRIQQIYRCHFKKKIVSRNGYDVCIWCGKIDGHKL